MSTRQNGTVKDVEQGLKNGVVKTRVTKAVARTVAAYAARRGIKSAQVYREAIWEYLLRHPLPKRKRFVSN